MKYKELRPVRNLPEYWQAIERRIRAHLRKQIYEPLLKELGEPKDLLNAKPSLDALIRSIESGQIQYVRGHFDGNFDAATSKALKGIGAQWDRTHGWWKVPRSKLSADMRGAIGTSSSRFEQMAHRVDKKLASILPEEVAATLSLKSIIDRSLWAMNSDFESSVKSVTVKPMLTQAQIDVIERDYTDNMRRKIKGWTEEEIGKLREKVKKNTLAGGRYESLIKTIQRSNDVSENKARFLAKQETSLCMAKFRETRFKSIGSDSYRWRCRVGSSKSPVRPMHRALDGKTFTWDNPPITDRKGNRNHPGEDYGCLCIAIPLLPTKAV